MYELSPEQILLIGLLATVLAAFIRFFFVKVLQKEIHKGWATIIVAAASLLLAVVWNLPAFPPLNEPMVFLGALAHYLSAIVGSATLIYNLLLSKILDKLFPTAFRIE